MLRRLFRLVLQGLAGSSAELVATLAFVRRLVQAILSLPSEKDVCWRSRTHALSIPRRYIAIMNGRKTAGRSASGYRLSC